MPGIVSVTLAGIVVHCVSPLLPDADESLFPRRSTPQGIQELFTYGSALRYNPAFSMRSAADFLHPRNDSEMISMPTVLVVDDNSAMCLMLAAVLENHGYDVQAAADGVRAQSIPPGRYAL
jgi:hypothetical protein